jgi:hypothetical protein
VLSDPRQPDCPIVHASPTFLDLTGYSREEVEGRNCRFLQVSEGVGMHKLVPFGWADRVCQPRYCTGCCLRGATPGVRSTSAGRKCGAPALTTHVLVAGA